MIKLEQQYVLTINDQSNVVEDPKRGIANYVFDMANMSYNPDFLDNFLLEVKDELQTLKKFQDSLIESNNESLFREIVNKVLESEKAEKHISAWVLLVNHGLAVKREIYPSFLTENGQNLLDILIELYPEEETESNS